MTSCTYRILGFATSNLKDEDFVFAIVLRFDDLPNGKVISYILEDWEMLVAKGDYETEILYVENIFYDLRQQDPESYAETEALFSKMEQMNMGPIRTVSSGTRKLPSLGAIHPGLNDDRGLPRCNGLIFHTILKLLTSPE